MFIGSSQESAADLRRVASWVESQDMEPLCWDDPKLFLPGENIFDKLVEISKQVDAAIFIFGEDDGVAYRDQQVFQPRDNILIEFGLFVGQLGRKRAIICKKGDSKTATDLLGVTYVTIDPANEQSARLKLFHWMFSLSAQTEDPAITKLVQEREAIRRQRDALNERLVFEQHKARDLARIVTSQGQIDFESYDLDADGHWKLLFDYEYFWRAVKVFATEMAEPANWRKWLEALRLDQISSRISVTQDYNSERTEVFVAKTLRVLRMYELESGPQRYATIVQHLPYALHRELSEFAAERARQLKIGNKLDAETPPNSK